MIKNSDNKRETNIGFLYNLGLKKKRIGKIIRFMKSPTLNVIPPITNGGIINGEKETNKSIFSRKYFFFFKIQLKMTPSCSLFHI